MYREFIVPSDQEILEAVCEWPEEEGETRIITLQGENSDSIIFSYNSLATSIRILWKNEDSEEVLDIFREGATLMRVGSTAHGSFISIQFDTGDFSGRTEISISSKFRVTDQLFLT